jgi:LDH2 family malate/lactate/ureidoglycolate dehydrogenase
VIIPGEPEAAMEINRRQDGIPLAAAVVADLQELAGKFGIPFK